MFNRFTERTRKCIGFAKEEARRLNKEAIGSEHLLLGLIKEHEGVAAHVLEKFGLDLQVIRAEVEKLIQQDSITPVVGDIPFTANAKRSLELSAEEARMLGHNYIGTEHLLLGLIKLGEGNAYLVLVDLGLSLQKLRHEVMEICNAGQNLSDIENTKALSEVIDLRKRIAFLETKVKQLEDLLNK